MHGSWAGFFSYTKMPPRRSRLQPRANATHDAHATRRQRSIPSQNSACIDLPNHIASSSQSVRFESLPDSVLMLMLRHLPRKVLMRLRLAGQAVCSRLSTLLSDERMCDAIGFERRLHVPASLGGVNDIAAVLRRVCRRFAIGANASWSLSLDVAVREGGFWCGGMTACGAGGVFAAVATTPLDIQLRMDGVASSRLGAAEAASLAVALRTIMPRLKLLDLASHLSAAGAASISSVLASMPQLTSLHIARNFVGAAGATSLAPALASMLRLQRRWLRRWLRCRR